MNCFAFINIRFKGSSNKGLPNKMSNFPQFVMIFDVWLLIKSENCFQKCSIYWHSQNKMHYANTPMQYTAIFHGCKNVHFQMKMFNIFLIFAQNIDCGYTLEPPQRGGSNEYPQSMFWSKNKKKMYTPVNPSFTI